MTEMVEGIAIAMVHVTPDDKCPFCPGETKNEDFTTYGGKDNNSKKLRTIMENPSELVNEQSNCRPKEGKARQQNKDGPKLESDISNGDTYYSFQAHHAIPGNQALKTVTPSIQKYIIAGEKIVKDTGYSVNNCANGVFLPSYPKQYRGKWSGMDGTNKQKIANEAMKKFKAQFHCGEHDIDIDGLDPTTHTNYVKYVKGRLKNLHGALVSWEKVCPFDDNSKKKKHWGNVLIHNGLDGISCSIQKQLKGSKKSWRFFISRYAKNYKLGIDRF
jgi:hypothetical protein